MFTNEKKNETLKLFRNSILYNKLYRLGECHNLDNCRDPHGIFCRKHSSLIFCVINRVAVLNLPLVNLIYFFFIEQTQTSLGQLLNDATYDVYLSKAVKTLMC